MSYTIKPSFETNCFQCSNKIEVKWCPPRQNYSNKNHWGYWTDKEESQNKYICCNCLISMYRNDKQFYLNSITDSKKRRLLRTYIDGQIIHV